MVRDQTQTRHHRTPFFSRRQPIEPEINQKCCGLLVVPYEVAHQDIEYIIVYRNGLAKARHCPWIAYTDKRTSLFALPLPSLLDDGGAAT